MRSAVTYRGARRNFRRSDRETGRKRGTWRGVKPYSYGVGHTPADLRLLGMHAEGRFYKRGSY